MTYREGEPTGIIYTAEEGEGVKRITLSYLKSGDTIRISGDPPAVGLGWPRRSVRRALPYGPDGQLMLSGDVHDAPAGEETLPGRDWHRPGFGIPVRGCRSG